MNIIIVLAANQNVNLKPFSKYCDGNDVDLRTGEMRVYYYDLPQTLYDQLIELAQQHGLKIENTCI